MFIKEVSYIFTQNHNIMLIERIGKATKTRRKELGITQTTLAELSGVSKNTIYKLERGENNPSLEIVDKILEVLGLDLKIEIKQD